MELEESNIEFKPVTDRRPTMPPPPPVQLVAVDDLRLTSVAGREVAMDDFYLALLKFEREVAVAGMIVYKAENFRLCFDVIEKSTPREEMRTIGVNVPALSLLETQLVERQIEFQWQKSLMPGADTILVQDPSGNWLAIGQGAGE